MSAGGCNATHERHCWPVRTGGALYVADGALRGRKRVGQRRLIHSGLFPQVTYEVRHLVDESPLQNVAATLLVCPSQQRVDIDRSRRACRLCHSQIPE